MPANFFFPCQICGATLQVPNITTGAFVRFTGSTLSCWRCGGRSPIPDGTYDFANSTFAAFRTAGPSDVARLQLIAQAAVAGEITETEAAQQAGQVRQTFAALIAFASEWQLLPILISLMALYLAWDAKQGDVAARAAADADARAAQSRQELQIALDQQTVAQLAHLNEQVSRIPPPATVIQQGRPGMNRKERRRAEAASRRDDRRP